MQRTTHTLKTKNARWVFEPRGNNVEVSETAHSGELGIQGNLTKLDARELWKQLRSDGALWEATDVWMPPVKG